MYYYILFIFIESIGVQRRMRTSTKICKQTGKRKRDGGREEVGWNDKEIKTDGVKKWNMNKVIKT